MIPSRLVLDRAMQLFTLNSPVLNDVTDPLLHFAIVTAPFTNDPTLTLADLEILTVGLAQSQLVIADPMAIAAYYNPGGAGYVTVLFPLAYGFYFHPEDAILPVTAYGWALIGQGGTVLAAVEAFPVPVAFNFFLEVLIPSQIVFNVPVDLIS